MAQLILLRLGFYFANITGQLFRYYGLIVLVDAGFSFKAFQVHNWHLIMYPHGPIELV